MGETRSGGIGPILGTFLVATTMIGSGIYMLPATLAAFGSISTIAWIVAAIGAIMIGLTLATLARVEPGGCFLDSTAQALGPLAGLVAAVLYVMSAIISVPMIAIACAGYTSFLFPFALSPNEMLALTIAYVWLFVGVAWSSASVVARFGTLTLVVGLIPLALVAIAGWAHFDPEVYRASWNVTGNSDASAVLSATMVLFGAYFGLENASIISERFKDARRDVPISTIAGVIIATIIYVASTTVVSGLIPAETLGKSTAPFADATAIIIGPLAAMLIAVCGATKAAGTLGAVQLGTVESVLVLKRQFTGRRASRPVANLTVGIIATLIAFATASPNIATQFGVLATATVATGMFCYALASLALLKVRGGFPRTIACFALLFSVGLIVAQPQEDIVVGGGLILAVFIITPAIYFWRRRVVVRPA